MWAATRPAGHSLAQAGPWLDGLCSILRMPATILQTPATGATDFAQPRLQGLGFACCRAPCPPGPPARLGRACASPWRPLEERRGWPPAHGRVAARAYACAVNHRFQGRRPGAIADARRLSPAPAGMGQNAAYAVCPKLGRRMGGIRRPLTTTAPANPLRRKHEWESPYSGPFAVVKRSGREPLA